MVPDLVVEILSKKTRTPDRGRKKVYAACGVREYWLIDPEKRAITVLVLEGKRFAREQRHVDGDRFESRVLNGLEVVVNDLLGEF